MPRHAAALIVFVLALCCLGPCVLARGPLFDYDCAAACTAKDGWDPVCADDGRVSGVTGTLYPNYCTLESECTTGIDAGTAYYKYLPFDDSTCSSAVGCSLLGKAVSRCRALWAAAADPNPTEEESPKVSPDCECNIEASKLVTGDPANATPALPMPVDSSSSTDTTDSAMGPTPAMAPGSGDYFSSETDNGFAAGPDVDNGGAPTSA